MRLDQTSFYASLLQLLSLLVLVNVVYMYVLYVHSLKIIYLLAIGKFASFLDEDDNQWCQIP